MTSTSAGSTRESRTLLGLAWPSAVMLLARIGMGLTDTCIVGHLSTEYLAAASYAQIWINVTTSFIYQGLGGGVNTLCSQAFGAGNYPLVGIWLQLAVIASLAASIPMMVPCCHGFYSC